mgnify:CR=1 FL=1
MYIHRNFTHPGGVSPVKHAAHYPGNKANHTIADHAKRNIKTVKKEVKKEFIKASDKLGEKIDSTTKAVKKGAKEAWDQAGYAYQAYKSTPVGKSSIQAVSDVLAVASVPANIIAEAVEGIGGKGDGEFNFTDAMPDLSSDRGSFNFKNMNGQPTKSVSAVAEIENPYLAFAVDLATDPSAYLGAGVVKNAVTKTIKNSAKTLVKRAKLPPTTIKKITKTIDSGGTSKAAPKGGVDGGNVNSKVNANPWAEDVSSKVNVAEDVYYKDITNRTIPNRGGKSFTDPMGEYNSIKSMHNELPDNVVKPGNPVFNEAGDLTGYNMEKVKGVDLDTWMQNGNKFSKEMYEDIFTKITGLNKKGIYHGDIKINNIMIDESGTWKLIDPVGFNHADNMSDDMLKVAQDFDAKSLEDLGKHVK